MSGLVAKGGLTGDFRAVVTENSWMSFIRKGLRAREEGQIPGPWRVRESAPVEVVQGDDEVLELELRGDLKNARLNGCAIDEAEGYVGRARVRSGKLHPVEEIVGIRAELQVVVLVDW